jgi:hypothetical protein
LPDAICHSGQPVTKRMISGWPISIIQPDLLGRFSAIWRDDASDHLIAHAANKVLAKKYDKEIAREIKDAH